MKPYIILLISILMILLLNMWQVNYLKNTSKYLLADIVDIKNSTKRKDTKDLLEGIDALESTWNNVKDVWDILGEHDDIEKISEHIQSMRVYATYEDIEELVNEYTLLETLIHHVIESEMFSFSNVL